MSGDLNMLKKTTGKDHLKALWRRSAVLQLYQVYNLKDNKQRAKQKAFTQKEFHLAIQSLFPQTSLQFSVPIHEYEQLLDPSLTFPQKISNAYNNKSPPSRCSILKRINANVFFFTELTKTSGRKFRSDGFYACNQKDFIFLLFLHLVVLWTRNCRKNIVLH